MKNIPEKIYLQIDADGETPEDFNGLEVTWSTDRINENDLEYHASTLNREIVEENERLKKTLKQIHNKIMVQWEKDYGSIHSEQPMDAYTVSGFIKALLSESSKEDKPLE
jgi:hypothetical protein